VILKAKVLGRRWFSVARGSLEDLGG
jgi:hypothetical protein